MNNALQKLHQACSYGGQGFSENVLLHNAAECLKELAKGHPNEETLMNMKYVEELHRKAEMEHDAVTCADEFNYDWLTYHKNLSIRR